MAAPDAVRSGPRVLFVMSQRDYASNGGVASLLELLRGLRRVERHVWTSHDNDFTRKLESAAETVEVRASVAAGGSLAMRARRALASNLAAYRVVRGRRIEVVHVNDRVAFWRTAIGAKLAGARVLDNLRDTQLEIGGLRVLRWALEFLIADEVVVLSEDMKRRWGLLLPVSTAGWRVVYSAVDPARFRPRPPQERSGLRTRLGIGAGELALLYVGAFRPKKRQLEFIREAVPGILRAAPGARLHFLGDFRPDSDPYARACRDAADALGGAVVFHGHQAAVADWYAAADLTLLASEQEGLARSMIESLACGTPVASFDVASAAEILRGHDVGWVASEGAYGELVDIVRDWAADAPRHGALRERAAEVASRLFSPELSARGYEAVYG